MPSSLGKPPKACCRSSTYAFPPSSLPFRHHAAFRSAANLAVHLCPENHVTHLRGSSSKPRRSCPRRLFALRLASCLLFFWMRLGVACCNIVAHCLALGNSLAYVFFSFAVPRHRLHRLSISTPLFCLRSSFPLRSCFRPGSKPSPSCPRRLFASRLLSCLLFLWTRLGVTRRSIVADCLALGNSIVYVFFFFAVPRNRLHRLSLTSAFN